MTTLLKVPAKRVLVIILIALSSCNNSEKNSSLIFEELSESLERSTKNITLSTKEAIQDLESKTHRPETAERSMFWIPKVNSIVAASKLVCDSIDDIKARYSEIQKEDFSKIYELLNKYSESILNSDPVVKKQFEGQIDLFNNNLEVSADKTKTKLLLSKLKNDIKNIENMAVVFCKNQVGFVDGPGFYREFQAIAAANSTKLGIGEELIITTGIGEFSNTAKPDIIINGMKIQQNENGVAEYRMKVGSKIGKQKINVKISYTAPDGVKDSLNKDIEYTVVE